MTDIAGIRLKKLREEKGWSLRELENRSSINYSVISRIESGQRPLYGSEAVKFSDLFDVSTDYLLGKTDIRNPEKQSEGRFFHDLDHASDEDLDKLEEYFKFLQEQKKKRENRDK